MLQAVLTGATTDGLESVEVTTLAALSSSVADVLEADGYLLGTPANFGYMSGALKHFFDTVYYPCLHETKARPYGMFVHGNNDVDGAVQSIERIVAGLQWRAARPPVKVTGEPDQTAKSECWELGAALAAQLLD